MDNCSETYSIVINALIAIGTIAVAVLAIWGDWIRSKVVPPKLIVQSHNLRGAVIRSRGGARFIYYHLKAVNSRPWSPAKNCRVILHGLSRRSPDQQFRPVPLPVPLQFVWTPAEFTPPVIGLSREQVLDFGRVGEGQSSFQPLCYWYPDDSQGHISANEAVRYSLEILADGYIAKRYQVFEVAWNGKWSDNLDQMAQNLVIREISEPQQ